MRLVAYTGGGLTHPPATPPTSAPSNGDARSDTQSVTHMRGGPLRRALSLATRARVRERFSGELELPYSIRV